MNEAPVQVPRPAPLPSAVRALFPFTPHYADVGGHAMHYLDEGRGEPLLMLHGNPTWSFYYRGLVTALSDRWRTIVPDHIGCGLSAKPDDAHYDFTLERRVQDVERLVEGLGLGNDLTLVLHDWGGMIGMAYAARHPERIKRIILANTAAFHLPRTKAFPLALKVCRDTAVGALLVRGFGAFSKAAAHTCVKRQPMPADVRAGYLAPYDSWNSRRAILRFVQDIPLTAADPSYRIVSETEAALARLRHLPMLILWGARDFVFDDHFLRSWIQRFPEAEVHRFADAGHYVLEDAAAEAAELVRDFLERRT